MTAGDVVLLHFPYSDLTGSKLRPAVVLAAVERGDFIAVQVTSKNGDDSRAIELTAADFAAGGLHQISFVRPTKLFTASRRIVSKRVARLNDRVLSKVIEALVNVLHRRS